MPDTIATVVFGHGPASVIAFDAGHRRVAYQTSTLGNHRTTDTVALLSRIGPGTRFCYAGLSGVMPHLRTRRHRASRREFLAFLAEMRPGYRRPAARREEAPPAPAPARHAYRHVRVY